MSGANCVHLFAQRGHGWHAPFGAPLPSLIAGSESIFGVVVVGKARARECVARTISLYPPPHEVRGRGTTRRVVEGACGRARFESDAPSTTLLRRVVPLPRFAGQDEVKVLP